MEPQIQYVKTEDGVSIAYYAIGHAIGQGPATLYLLMPQSHLEVEWQIGAFRTRFTAAAQRSTFIRLDPRGFGLSDRDPDDFAIDSFVLDIEAVVDRLGLDKLRIYSIAYATMPALVYTARHPDKVTHLVLHPPATSGRDMSNERLDKLWELAKVDRELAMETAVRTIMPEFTDQLGRDMAGLLIAAIEPTSMFRFFEDVRQWDADTEAKSVSAPTLLIQSRDNPNFEMATTRRVAGLIKDSRVAFVDSALEGVLLAQTFFEGDGPDWTQPASTHAATSTEASVHTILFTDMESSTALARLFGDRRAQEVRRVHYDIVRSALNDTGGNEIKHTGDGIMASFPTASSALNCAIAIQQSVASHKDEHPDSPLGVYVGLNAGEPIAEDDDLFGTSVDLAARLVDHAQPGQIIASDVVRQLAAGKDFLFADLGETELRGFEDPVKLWELRWQEDD